MQVATAYSRFF